MLGETINFFSPLGYDVQIKCNMFALELTDAYRILNLINKKIILRLINELLRSEGLNRAADH